MPDLHPGRGHAHEQERTVSCQTRLWGAMAPQSCEIRLMRQDGGVSTGVDTPPIVTSCPSAKSLRLLPYQTAPPPSWSAEPAASTEESADRQPA